jgi:hypothetical protein
MVPLIPKDDEQEGSKGQQRQGKRSVVARLKEVIKSVLKAARPPKSLEEFYKMVKEPLKLAKITLGVASTILFTVFACTPVGWGVASAACICGLVIAGLDALEGILDMGVEGLSWIKALFCLAKVALGVGGSITQILSISHHALWGLLTASGTCGLLNAGVDCLKVWLDYTSKKASEGVAIGWELARIALGGVAANVLKLVGIDLKDAGGVAFKVVASLSGACKFVASAIESWGWWAKLRGMWAKQQQQEAKAE